MGQGNCNWKFPDGSVCWRHAGHPVDFHENQSGTRAGVVTTNPEWNRQSWPHHLDPQPGGLEGWWAKTDKSDWEAFGPKLAEYGARDLVAHGRAIYAMGGHEPDDGNEKDDYMGELGCMFYLHGKLARAMEAYVNGKSPSEDTLKDIETYARMARAFRARGGLA